MQTLVSRSPSIWCVRFAGFLWATLLVTGLLAEEPKTETPPPATEQQDTGQGPFPQRFDAPSLDGDNGWLNIDQPLTWKDLRGKVVLLDFWTYCCINCMHVLPDLAYLESKYEKELVVIGVHSAKFENEQDSSAIRSAIQRYEIAHPVINDAEMTIWRKYRVRSWPTLVIVDPEGKYIGFVSGEGNRAVLDEVIGKLVEYHRLKGTLNEEPLRFDLEANKLEPTPLRFPGKVLADAASDRLFISDSNHNRIVITTLEGDLVDVVGSGKIGRDDGDYSSASFDHPQGMALVGNHLYVADTENHLLRKIDLDGKQVTTLAGTGAQASFRASGGTLLETALSSPWDLVELNGDLYVAMAGPHQLWRHQLGSNTIDVFAGSGREDIIDGRPQEAALAQPSGITSDGKSLYFVDSEGSAVRRVGNEPVVRISTVAGPRDLPRGRSLFEFGDVDGAGPQARFQHPLGITHHNGTLYVADSYNHKIRLVSAKTGQVTSYLGTGKAGNSLANPLQFSEPAGLTIAGNSLYVADTNNHRIVKINLDDQSAQVLPLTDLQPPRQQ
ncbi:MAG: redoxin domain-containing protein [Planctomycetaceae bacterium]|nr:redoxin domain-containing protein [Planctomycetaceae bacterium]